MIQLKQKIQSKNSILDIVEGVFPYAKVMFIYYCGSVAYGLNNESSDEDVTVVLEGFEGNVHLCLGSLDIFAYGRDIYKKKQDLDPSVPLYDRAHIDEIVSSEDNLIYLNEIYREDYEHTKYADFVSKIGPFLESFIEYYSMRTKDNIAYKSHYHIFRIRGILDHLDQTGRYELVVEEPWKSKMIEYKNNWDNELGRSYLPLILEQLNYIRDYKDKVMKKNELG
jgi:predicted nucleotidyltransferase